MPRTTTSNPSQRTARAAALKLLALRRLTESQLWTKLAAKGYPEPEIAEAVASCKRDGFLDDALFATLYVDGKRKAVGNARLVAELVRRGIDRESAQSTVAASERDEASRIAAAYDRVMRSKPNASYQSAARALERLGFPTALIYRTLRERAQHDLGGFDRD